MKSNMAYSISNCFVLILYMIFLVKINNFAEFHLYLPVLVPNPCCEIFCTSCLNSNCYCWWFLLRRHFFWIVYNFFRLKLLSCKIAHQWNSGMAPYIVHITITLTPYLHQLFATWASQDRMQKLSYNPDKICIDSKLPFLSIILNTPPASDQSDIYGLLTGAAQFTLTVSLWNTLLLPDRNQRANSAIRSESTYAIWLNQRPFTSCGKNKWWKIQYPLKDYLNVIYVSYWLN